MSKKKKPNDSGNIVKEVLEANSKAGRENYQVIPAPKGVTVYPEGDAPIVGYDFAADFGRVVILFDSQKLSGFMLQECGKRLDAFLNDTDVADHIGKSAPLRGMSIAHPSSEERGQLIRRVALDAARTFIYGLESELSFALKGHEQDVLDLAEGLIRSRFRSAAERHGHALRESSDVREKVKHRLNLDRKKRAALLKGVLDSFDGKADTSGIAGYYRALLPKYQNAKAAYRRNKLSPKWREYVTIELPEVAGHPDLLARLIGREGDLPDDVRAALAATGVGTAASDLAAEHAARLCGVSPNSTPRSTLFEWIKRGANDDTPEIEGVH